MNKEKYRFKYEYSYPYGSNPQHLWSCVGSKGAIHVHITDYGEENKKEYRDRYSGGIEVHHRKPPDYMDTAPSHNNCWLLGGPCWHDGSSLQAREHWIPLWIAHKDNHEYIFCEIERAMEEVFYREAHDED